NMLTLLKPIEAVTKLLSALSYPTIEYWAIIDEPSVVSAVFDPHTKFQIFNKEKATITKKIVQKIMSQYIYEY
ncbi:35752_t:CDS:2, partial [Racocetra persica]